MIKLPQVLYLSDRNISQVKENVTLQLIHDRGKGDDFNIYLVTLA